MPANFTRVFAERLARRCAVPVKEAEQGDHVVPNAILIAPGGLHLTIVGSPSQAHVTLIDGPPVSGHKPSVHMLFQSGARVYRSAATGVIMTGMGRDGVTLSRFPETVELDHREHESFYIEAFK
jgi:two-component system, chemotaxis family, protein-glutamate methylesterase/glutaminase